MNEIKNQPKALHSRYIKKPVTVEAIQWTGDNLRDVISFTNGPPYDRSDHAGMSWEDYCELVARDGLKIFTLEGKMNASVGDWIIRGIKGELYPCKPDIFEETYVPAPATQSDTYRCQAPQGYVRPQEPDSHDGHDYEGFIGGCQRMRCKASVADVDVGIPITTSATMSDEQIKAVFLANGFTIKPGCDDLKPYVYAAARALLAISDAEVGKSTTRTSEPVNPIIQMIRDQAAEKAVLVAKGVCPTCKGKGECGGQFTGGEWVCEDCNGSGRTK